MRQLSKQEIITRIEELNKARSDIKINIDIHKENPFYLFWHWSNSVIKVNMSNESFEKHNKNKVKLAKDFLKLVDKDIRDLEKQLKGML